jgi:hypothetical protein
MNMETTKKIKRIQSLGPDGIKEVISKLESILPNRKIFPAYPNYDHGWRQNFNYKGKRLDLQTEFEMFHSMDDWKTDYEMRAVEKYRPDKFQIYVEKFSNYRFDMDFPKSLYRFGFSDEEIGHALEEQREVKSAFDKIGIPHDHHCVIRAPSIHDIIGRINRLGVEEYWQSAFILHADGS